MLLTARAAILLVLSCLCAAGFAADGRAADRFSSVIDDLPLMTQLQEVADSAVVYSKPQGRIVEFAARGAVTRDAVLAFYADTLPQLGWSRGAGATSWQREHETLTLSFENGSGGLTVQFSLAPR